jgi:hypothetical protein
MFPISQSSSGPIGPINGILPPNGQNYSSIHDTKSPSEVIKQSIKRILMTTPGERVMQPEFGCKLKSIVFEPNDSVLVGDIHYILKEAIKRWEPRVVVEFIDIQQYPDNYEVVVTIKYLNKFDNSKDVLSLMIK